MDFHLNIKRQFYQYRNSNHKGKMVVKLSYLYDTNSYTWNDSIDIKTDPRGPSQ